MYNSEEKGISTIQAGIIVLIIVIGAAAGAYFLTAESNPGKFKVTDLVVSPENVGSNETVEVSAEIKNAGDETRERKVNLLVNGESESSETVELEKGESKTVDFETSREEKGNYEVKIDAQDDSKIGTFTVEPEPVIPAGEVVKCHMEYDGYERSYEYYLPSDYDNTESLPMLFSFHGLGSTGEEQRQMTGFTDLAEEEDFIAVFPDSTEFEGDYENLPDLPGAERQWNTGIPISLQYEKEVNDVGFTSEIIDILAENYKVDESRIYATGMSNGSMFSYVLAVELSDKIAAAAAVASPMSVNLLEQEPERPVSMVIMMGENDPIVSYEGDNLFLLSIEETVDYWIDVNGITGGPEETYLEEVAEDDPTSVKRTYYGGGGDNSEVILYTIENGGHAWPGSYQYAPVNMIGRVTQQMNASEVIWNHFENHSLS